MVFYEVVPYWDPRFKEHPGLYRILACSESVENKCNYPEDTELEKHKLRSLATGFFDNLTDKTQVNIKFHTNYPWTTWRDLKEKSMF